MFKIPDDYAQRIQQFRERHGLTQTRLAQLLGVTPALISQWESGKARPGEKRWQHFLRGEALGVYALTKDFDAPTPVKEAAASYVTGPDTLTTVDFGGEAEIVRLILQGYRLAYGHEANPAFATETSQIEPLPHQRAAVYDRMLPNPRLRFLLADDAGAGKTIMAGLYIREILTRRLFRRVLVVPPAGLVGNWESEMHKLFSLPFRALDGNEAKTGNPFSGPESDLCIVSIDTLAGERMFARLQEPDVVPYDLVIFDEAHKLSADREPNLSLRKTQRYRLAEALVGIPSDEARWSLPWNCPHVLLLTATPHMGKDFPYYCLWRLLEPEMLATYDAFLAYPPEARRAHFIRRTKEEMVDFQGNRIYPQRLSDTLSYELGQEPGGEQQLYDEMTQYMNVYYNQARILNRSAARLAMSVFQRRMASSTYAMLRSLENRVAKLEGLITAILSGELSEAELRARQQRLDRETRDVLAETTADEEATGEAQEEHETAEDEALGGVIAVNLAQLQVERGEVLRLRDLARALHENPIHEDAKFARLLAVLRDPQYRDEKLIIFTEHRDTQTYLVRRLEQLGYRGEIAQIHGGMPYRDREVQREFFRNPLVEGGARYLVATDAAGEGINLQFCWIMVNYDVPWNPARLEQRMGRIHRYGQKHDPVIILNLIAGKTREGKVLQTLLDKLKAISVEMGRDKVFDVVGRVLAEMSIQDYMAQALTEEGAAAAAAAVAARLTPDQVEALEAEERASYGAADDLQAQLPEQQAQQRLEQARRLLPGHVRGFLEQAVPRLDIAIEGDWARYFALRPRRSGALDALWPVLETYAPERRERLTLYREQAKPEHQAIFVRPGEPVFERLAALFAQRYDTQALQGATFIDPTAQEAYLFHLLLVEITRQADAGLPALAHAEPAVARLVGVRQTATGQLEETPVEHLLLLRSGPGVYGPYLHFVAQAGTLCDQALTYARDAVAEPLAAERREALLHTLPERIAFLQKGYDYQEAELAQQRSHYREQMRAGDGRATAEYERIRARQKALQVQREQALTTLIREPELIAVERVTFLAHALALPSSDPEDKKLYDMSAELVAMREAIAYEEAAGARVVDVHTPPLARAAGLLDYPGYDMLSYRPDGEIRQIEVKGRAGTSGRVELSQNEWMAACSTQDAYWLYAVYGCATPTPVLLRVQNPFIKQLGAPKEGWVIDKQEIVDAAEM